MSIPALLHRSVAPPLKFSLRIGSAFAAILLLGSVCRAGSDAITEIFPWIEGNRVVLGMTRADFTIARPAAVVMFPGDTPPPAAKPFDGGYVEGAGGKPGSDLWLYSFKADRLRGVNWARKNEATEADTREIRRRLINTYGLPQPSTLARVTAAGTVARITREVYLTEKKGGYAVYLVATNEGGIEVTAMSVSDPEHPLADFEKSLSKHPLPGLKRDEGAPTIVDVLAKVSRGDGKLEN